MSSPPQHNLGDSDGGSITNTKTHLPPPTTIADNNNSSKDQPEQMDIGECLAQTDDSATVNMEGPGELG